MHFNWTPYSDLYNSLAVKPHGWTSRSCLICVSDAVDQLHPHRCYCCAAMLLSSIDNTSQHAFAILLQGEGEGGDLGSAGKVSWMALIWTLMILKWRFSLKV